MQGISMRLTSKTDFCLRVLIYLQSKPGKAKIQEIADSYGISKNHLSVAVNKLSELGYIHSTPGPKGGIEINNAKANNTVAQLIRSIEDFDIVECFNEESNTCTLSPHCKLKRMLTKASSSFLSELKNYKIKDLV
tara:strand:+ start:209 stop:613 length:405 start_codon:yes stop_codon:yes gene_type:complete